MAKVKAIKEKKRAKAEATKEKKIIKAKAMAQKKIEDRVAKNVKIFCTKNRLVNIK